MAAKKVVKREEVYEFLRKQKRPAETFSDVVLRLRGANQPLGGFAGAWKGIAKKDLAAIREAIRAGRDGGRNRIDRLLKRKGG